MIKKQKGQYAVMSETTARLPARQGRVFGRYRSQKAAAKRLGQIEFFKHQKSKSGKRK